MLLSPSLVLDTINPVNRSHPWAPDAWWLCVPGLMGGAVWHDIMSLPGDLRHGHHARLQGIAARPSATSGWQEGTQAPGGFGALAVDGAGDYADAGDHGFLSAGLSAMMWVVDLLPRSVSGFPGLVCKGNLDSSTSGSYILYSAAAGQYYWSVYSGGAVSSLAGAGGITVGVWQQVVATWQRSGPMATFVNGSKRAQGTGANGLVDSPAFSLLLGTAQGGGGPAAYPLNALLGSVRFYRNRVLSDQAIQEMYWHSRAGSPGLLRRIRPRLAAAGSLLVAVGQATETDLAQGMAWAPKARLVGQVSETDLAQGMTWAPQARLVAQASETDLSQPIAGAMGSDTIPVGQVSETDTSQAIAWSPKARLVAQVNETDLAQAIAWSPKARLVNQASETDLAQAIAPALGSDTIPIAQVSETDTSQAIIWAPQRRLVGQVSESDLAQAIVWSPKHRLVALVSESDLAQAMTVVEGAQFVAVGQVNETDLAQAIAWSPKARLVNQVTETDLAQALTAVLTMNTWILDDVVIAFTAHVFALPATPAWMAAAQHAATLAQLTGSYSPVLRLHLPDFARIFSTHPTLFGDEPLLARLDQGGVGAVTRALDEITGQASLGGSSFALLNQAGFQETFGTAPFLNSLAYIELGFIELAAADFLTFFMGVLDRYQFSHERLDFALIDSSVKDNVNLNVPISVELFPNAPAESRDKNIPIFFGVHTGAPTVQVSGLAATGRLAFTMDPVSVTAVMTEDAAHFPLSGTATVGAEAVSYLRRALINVAGRTYVELSGLTRASPASHGLDSIVTLTDLLPSYLTGFGVDTLNAIRVNGAALTAGNYSVSTLAVHGHLVPIIRLLAIPAPGAVVTVDVNAAAPLINLFPPIPPPVVPVGNQVVNGGFEAGATAWVTAAGGVLTAADGLAVVYLEGPELLVNGGFEAGDLTGWSQSVLPPYFTVGTSAPAPQAGTYWAGVQATTGVINTLNISQAVATVPFLELLFRCWYQNHPLAGPGASSSGAGLFVNSHLGQVYFVTFPALSPNVWTEVSGAVYVTTTQTRLFLQSQSLTEPAYPSYFDSASLHQRAPIRSAPYAGTGRGELRGGLGTYGEAYTDVPTVAGTVYEYRLAYMNVYNRLNGTSDTSDAVLQIGTAAAPTLYLEKALPIAVTAQYGALWTLVAGLITATTSSTRITLRSRYATTPLSSYFDGLELRPVPPPPVVPPGGTGTPILYQDAGENPVDVILYMLALFYPTATYNAQDFTTARIQLDSMRFRSLLTNPGDSATLLQRMGQQCMSLVLRNPQGEYTITVLDETRPVAAAFDVSTILTQGESPPASTFGRASVPVDSLYTSFYIYFDTFVGGSTSPGDYAGVVFATPTETTAPGGEGLIAACLSAYTLYGRDHRFDFYADFVRDIDSAHRLLAWLVSRHAVRQDTYAWRAWLDAVPLQLGQVVTVAHPVLANTGALVPAELVEWHYLPGDMEVELTAQTLGPTLTLDAPVAANIAETTAFNTAAPLNVPAAVTPGTGTGAGTTLLPDTVDLDPGTPGRQTSITDPRLPTLANPLKGTFTVDDNGIVTFTPATDVSGLAVSSYTMKDDQGHTSNVATISVTVEPVYGWVLLQTFVEPVDALLETGLHIINAFTFFASDIQLLVAVTGDPSLVGSTGTVLPPPAVPPGFNDVLTSTRLLSSPLNGTGSPWGRTSFTGSVRTTSAGNDTTAMVNVCFYGQDIYVAYNTALASDNDVNAGPVIYSLSTMDDYTLDSFAATWVEAHEWPATFVRIGAMIVHAGILYVAVEPVDTATGIVEIWQYNGTTWALYEQYDFGVSRLRTFCTFNGELYAGLNSLVDGSVMTVTGPNAGLSLAYAGPVEALVVRGGLLYVNERQGSTRNIWTSTNGLDRTLLHTLTNETSLLPGVMALGADNNLYVSLLEGGETRMYVYNGTTWAISHDWGTAFVGVSALYTASDNRLYAGLVRRLHASATTNNLPDAEIWYLSIDLG